MVVFGLVFSLLFVGVFSALVREIVVVRRSTSSPPALPPASPPPATLALPSEGGPYRAFGSQTADSLEAVSVEQFLKIFARIVKPHHAVCVACDGSRFTVFFRLADTDMRVEGRGDSLFEACRLAAENVKEIVRTDRIQAIVDQHRKLHLDARKEVALHLGLTDPDLDPKPNYPIIY